MRRIDISSYKWPTDGKGKPTEISDLLEMPQVAILKRLATERLGIEAEAFDAMLLEEANRPGADPEPDTDYLVRDSIVEILFHPNLQLGAKQLLDHEDLARKVKDWPDNDLLLEEAEYNKVKAGVDALHGLSRHDVEFVKRILNAPTVEVQAKPALAAGSATPTK